MRHAYRAIAAVAGGSRHNGLAIGAGTVLSIAAARKAVDAGATFLVMPHTDPGLVAWAAERGIPAFPGAATPTEVLAAWRSRRGRGQALPGLGARPELHPRAAGPFPDIPVVPTGGVTAETAGSFIAAGAVAVGLGSWLVGDADPAGVTDRARQVVAAVAAARAGRRA